MVPALNVDTYFIQNGLTATISSGNTSLRGMVVGNDSFGILSMTGGSLSLLDNNLLELGRERFPFGRGGDYNNNGVVDAADYTNWRDTLGQPVLNSGDGADGDESGAIDDGDYVFWKAHFGNVTKGGNVILTGNSILTANGAIVGRRTKALLSVGPSALVDVKGLNHITNDARTEYLRVGSYGADYGAIATEPGLEADGLVINQGTLNANVLLLNEHGAKGEFRLLPGGKVDLNGGVVMSYCDVQAANCGLVANPVKMSSKVSIVGSGGTFNVGRFAAAVSPPIDSLDPRPLLRRDIYSDFPATATFSFTADAGGVTPITVFDNGAGEFSGTVHLDGTVGNVPETYARMNLELNLDAFPFTPMSKMTLIDAPPGHLSGMFAAETYMSNTTTRATVSYDELICGSGNVCLIDFHAVAGAGAGSLAGVAVPEPSGLMMLLTLGLLLFTFGAGANRQRARLWGHQCLKTRA